MMNEMKKELNPEEMENVSGGNILDFVHVVEKCCLEGAKTVANTIMDAAGEVPLDAMGGI